MNGYVAQRRGRFYAVIYEGLDPVTGRERRTWHPAGTDRAAAEQLAARLAIEEQGRADAVRALTFGAYLSGQWLPGKKLQLATSTYRGYERKVELHILPALGPIGLRRLHAHRGSLRQAPHPGRGAGGAVAQDRVRDPPRHPRRPRRGGPQRAADSQRRSHRPLAEARSAPEDRSPVRGQPSKCSNSCEPQPDIGCSPCCSSPPSPGSVATKSSACSGPTSTSRSAGCRSTEGSWPSATSCTGHERCRVGKVFDCDQADSAVSVPLTQAFGLVGGFVVAACHLQDQFLAGGAGLPEPPTV